MISIYRETKIGTYNLAIKQCTDLENNPIATFSYGQSSRGNKTIEVPLNSRELLATVVIDSNRSRYNRKMVKLVNDFHTGIEELGNEILKDAGVKL